MLSWDRGPQNRFWTAGPRLPHNVQQGQARKQTLKRSDNQQFGFKLVGVPYLSFCILLVLGFGLYSPCLAKSPAPDFQLTSVQAKLFYSDTGTFSEDILTSPDFTLWNTIIGEGSAKGPSNSTLVLVEISGPSGGYGERRKVEFEASFRGIDRVVKQTSEIGVFGNNGKCFLGFWLYDTGCEPVKLVVKLTGQTKESSMTKTINFRCGE